MAKSFDQAVTCLNQGKLEESLKYFELALKETLPTQHTAIHCNVGLALIALNDFPSAISAFDDALSLKPDHFESLINRGIALSRLERFSEALDNFSRACLLSPQSYSALCGKSESLSHLGRYSEAIAAAKTACALDPSSSLGFADLGFAHLRAAQFKEAMEALSQAIALGDDSSETNDFYCTSLAQQALEFEIQGNRGEAIALMHKCNALSQPKSAQNLHNEGILLLASNRHEEAIDCFLCCLQYNPYHFEASLALGTLLAKQDYLLDAENHLLAACEADLGSVEARFNLGVVRVRQGNGPDARKEWVYILERIQQGEPNATEALRLLDLAMLEAKSNGSDGRKETLEVAKKIVKLTEQPISLPRPLATIPFATGEHPLPQTCLVLDGEHLNGMSKDESDTWLEYLERLETCPVEEATGTRVLSPDLLDMSKKMLHSLTAAKEEANQACDAFLVCPDEESNLARLIRSAAHATNLTAVSATNAFALFDAQHANLGLSLLEGSIQCAQAVMEASKLLLLQGDESANVVVESISDAVLESQEIVLEVCAKALEEDISSAHVLRSCQDMAQNTLNQVRDLKNSNSLVPLVVFDSNSSLMGESAQRMNTLERTHSLAGALLLCKEIGNENAFDQANVASCAASLAFSNRFDQPNRAVEVANAALVCATKSLDLMDTMPKGMNLAEDINTRHCVAVAIMRAAELCEETCGAADSNAQVNACEELSQQVLQRAVSMARAASLAKESLEYVAAAALSNNNNKRMIPMVVPFGSRILSNPVLLQAQAFHVPRPLVMVKPDSGTMMGMSGSETNKLLHRVETLNQSIVNSNVTGMESCAKQLIEECTASEKRSVVDPTAVRDTAANNAGLSGLLAANGNALVDANPKLAIEATKTALRLSLASLDAASELQNDPLLCDVSSALAATVWEATSICNETCEKILQASHLDQESHTSVMALRKASGEAMKRSLDISKQAQEIKASESYALALLKAKESPLVPLVVPFKTLPFVLPTVLKPVPFLKPRPLVITDPVTGQMVGMSTKEAEALVMNSAFSSTANKEELANSLMTCAEESAIKTKKSSLNGCSHADQSLNAAHTVNVSSVAAANANELMDTNPQLAIKEAKTSLRTSLIALEALHFSGEDPFLCDLADAAALAVMETSSMCSETVRKMHSRDPSRDKNHAALSQESLECENLALEVMKHAVNLSEAARNTRKSSLYQKSVQPTVLPVAAPIGSFVSTNFDSNRLVPLVLVDSQTGEVSGVTPQQVDAFLSQLNTLHDGNEQGIQENTQMLMKEANHQTGVSNNPTYDATLAGVLAAHALALNDPELAIEAANTSLRVIAALSSNPSVNSAVARSLLETSQMCTEVCRRRHGKNAATTTELANSCSKRCIDLVSQSTNRHGLVTLPFESLYPALRPIGVIRTANPTTKREALDYLAHLRKVQEACRATSQALFDHAQDRDDVRKTMSKACARSAGHASTNATTVAAFAHSLVQSDPELALQLAKASLDCATASFQCAEKSAQEDSLNSDVAFRVNKANAETARTCLEVVRLVSKYARRSLDPRLGLEANDAMKQASELTRRSLEQQESLRLVMGSASYLEAKARLRHLEQAKRKSIHMRKSTGVHSGSYAPFGQRLLKRTGGGGRMAHNVPDNTTNNGVFANVEQKLLSSVLREKDNFNSKFAPAAVKEEWKKQPVYKSPGGDHVFPFSELRSPNCPEGVDPTCKELYLSPSEFLGLFGKTMEEFNKFPAWKRTREKQAKNIF